MEGIKKFKVDTRELSQKEKVLLDKLIQAVELIAPLYLKQKNPNYLGANFYPADATKKEIERESKKNPAILSSYAFVERDREGKLRAVPYHIKFEKELKKISSLIKEAAQLSSDKKFAKYLKTQAQALLTDNYEKSDILLLKSDAFKINFIAGPFEWYLDELFAKKYAYQAWIGILNKEKTEEARKLVTTALSGQRKILPGSKKINVSKIKARVDKTIALSGLIAELLISSMNLPRGAKIIKKYGSELTVFEPALRLRFERDYLPIFRKIFDKKFQKIYSLKTLYQGAFYYTLFDEIAHSLIYYKDAEKRLKNFFYVFDEFFASTLGIKLLENLFLKGVISQKELESVLIFYICRNFSLRQLAIKKSDIAFHYQVRAAIAFNFLLKEGVIKVKGGGKAKYIHSLNFTKLSISIDQLSRILEYYLALGNYEEAKQFIKTYSSFDICRK